MLVSKESKEEGLRVFNRLLDSYKDILTTTKLAKGGTTRLEPFADKLEIVAPGYSFHAKLISGSFDAPIIQLGFIIEALEEVIVKVEKVGVKPNE